jgi:SAM-dependent methyltransferase
VKVCLACEARFESNDWVCPQCAESPTSDGFLRFSTATAEGAEAFPEGSFAYLSEQEEKSFWFRSRNELIGWALQKYFPHARSFFELGCGTGVVLAALRARRPEMSLCGGELFAAGLRAAQARAPGVPLYQLDGRRLPFEEEFDVVGAFDVLEHVDEDDVVLTQMHQAVRPGGGILLSVPQHPSLWSAADEFSRHRRRYTAEQLVGMVESAGFHVVRRTSFVSLLLPALALSRLRDRGKVDYDPWTEYRLPRAIEWILGNVMSAERRLIGLGLSFPIGSSLLLAAARR